MNLHQHVPMMFDLGALVRVALAKLSEIWGFYRDLAVSQWDLEK